MPAPKRRRARPMLTENDWPFLKLPSGPRRDPWPYDYKPMPLPEVQPKRELDRATVRKYLAIIEDIAKSDSSMSREAWDLLEEMLEIDVHVEPRLRDIDRAPHTAMERYLRDQVRRKT